MSSRDCRITTFLMQRLQCEHEHDVMLHGKEYNGSIPYLTLAQRHSSRADLRSLQPSGDCPSQERSHGPTRPRSVTSLPSRTSSVVVSYHQSQQTRPTSGFNDLLLSLAGTWGRVHMVAWVALPTCQLESFLQIFYDLSPRIASTCIRLKLAADLSTDYCRYSSLLNRAAAERHTDALFWLCWF